MGQTWQQSLVTSFPRSGDRARAQNVRMYLLARQPNVRQLQEAKCWALSRTSGYLWAQLCQGKSVGELPARRSTKAVAPRGGESGIPPLS